MRISDWSSDVCSSDLLVALFVAQARAVNATVDRVASAADVPDAVAEYLAAENLPASLKVAPDPRLEDVPWLKRPILAVTEGKTEGQDEVSVTAALPGIAETGTLLLHKSEERRVGKDCVRTSRSRGSPYSLKKK